MHVHFEKDAFNDVYYDLLEDDTRTQILFGGSSSGKSIFAAQRCIYDLLRGGRNYLCCRNTAKYIRVSQFQELKKYINYNNLRSLFHINKSEMTVTCSNGYQALMTGLDDVEKVKSITPAKGVLTDIWIEEATECREDDIKQLTKRLRGRAGGKKKRLMFTFNPILKSHWIYKSFFKNFGDDDKIYKNDQLLIFKTTYKDNKFLELDDIQALENETDEYYYQVYTLGNWGVLGDLIFKNWKVLDVRNDPISQTFDIFKHGLDFGYSNDPTAYVKLYRHRATNKLYIIDEYRDLEVTNDQIADNLKSYLNGDQVVCDSAEPKSIAELNNYGISAVGAKKGKDSVNHGIQWLKQQEIIIDKSCQYTKNEFEQYHWKKDKDGNVLNVPVDRYNHHIDAIRYACESEMLAGDGEIIAGAESEAAQDDWDF